MVPLLLDCSALDWSLDCIDWFNLHELLVDCSAARVVGLRSTALDWLAELASDGGSRSPSSPSSPNSPRRSSSPRSALLNDLHELLDCSAARLVVHPCTSCWTAGEHLLDWSFPARVVGLDWSFLARVVLRLVVHELLDGRYDVVEWLTVESTSR